MINFPELVYPRVNHAVLETKQKDMLFTMIHGLYKNRDRLFHQNRTDDPLCLNQACRNTGSVQTIEHIACSCYRVKTVWLWVREKLLELLSDPRSIREAEVVFLIGTYMELVEKEAVIKQKELLVGTTKGVLKAKVGQMASRAAPEIIFPQAIN